MAELLRQMAELLQPRLNDRRGPVPQVPRIMAAILVARDSLPAREACRTVRGWQDAMGGDEPLVPNDAHSSITRLAVRVRALIDRDAHEGAQQQQSPAAQPTAAVVPLGLSLPGSAAAEGAAAESEALGLPPLAAVPNHQPSLPLALPELLLTPPQSSALPHLQAMPSLAQAARVATVGSDQAAEGVPERARRLKRGWDVAREHAFDAAAAVERLSAWSDQLPDDMHVVHASYQEDDGSSSSTVCWNGSLSEGEKRMWLCGHPW